MDASLKPSARQFRSTGAVAASKFRRAGAMPPVVMNVLAGKRGVRGLGDELASRMLDWAHQSGVSSYSEMCSSLTISVCEWADVQNHDPRIWREPDNFNLSRFLQRKQSPCDFIPQGGGDFRADHQCAGERITISLMGIDMRTLLERMSYQVPEQNLAIDISTLPALPANGFTINDVKLRRSHAA